MRRLMPLVSVSLSAVLAPVTANSGVTIPACLRVCPQEDIVTMVIVRDAANQPVPNSTVVVDFSLCPGFVLGPPDGTEGYMILPGPMVSKLTDAAGEAAFPIRAGGVCHGSPAISVDGEIARQYAGVASPDQDGNLVVDDVDEAIFVNTKLGTLDVTGDFDCDGDADAVDLFTLRGHKGHTPVAPRSWGELKVRYR